MVAARLVTERLSGEPFTQAGWPLLEDIRSHPLSGRFLARPGAPLPEGEDARFEAQAIALRFAESWASDGFGPYIWRLAGRPVGYAGLRRGRFEGQEVLEALWGFLPAHHGRGYATEAARAAVAADGPAPEDDAEISAWATPGNHASFAVMKKLGLRFVRNAAYRGVAVRLYRGRMRPLPEAQP